MTTETQQHRLNAYHRAGSGAWTLMIDGVQKVVPRDHPKYAEVQEAVKAKDADTLWDLLNPAPVVKEFLEISGVSESIGVEIKFDEVFVDGEPVHDALTRQILRFRDEGLDYGPLVNFLARKSRNPSFRAQKELWRYLDHYGTPVTPEGRFIGYKVVRSDWTDKHSGTVLNKPGALLTEEEKATYPKQSGKATLRIDEEGNVEVSVPRHTVDDNYVHDCSYGLHVGAISYVRQFRGNESEHVLLVAVDPADVVTVPNNETNKLRTCRYTILGEYEGDIDESYLEGAVYSQSSRPSDGDDPEDEDDDTEDEDDDTEDEDDDY